MKFYYRPIFIGWINLLLSLPWALALGILGFAAARIAAPPAVQTGLIAAAALGVCAFLTGAVYLVRRINHAHTEYRFYDDRIEYRQNFLTYTTKTFAYRDITKLQMHQDMLMKPWHMGSVYITMKKHGGGDNAPDMRSLLGMRSVTKNGLIIRDVENPKAACRRIAEISGLG